MSKTYHDKRRRVAGLEGRVHHEHGPNSTCPFCGKAAKGKSKKREFVALHSELDRITNPNELLQLVHMEDV